MINTFNRNMPIAIGIAGALMLGSTGAIAAQKGGDMTRAQAQAKAAERFAKLDVNGDGMISAADREAKMRERFSASDTDGNGQLSLAEVQAAQEQRKARRGQGEAQAGEERASRKARGKRAGKGGKSGAQMLARIDSDNSGTISQAEFTAASLARFAAADADNDGIVTASERRDARSEQRAQKRERREERRAAQQG